MNLFIKLITLFFIISVNAETIENNKCGEHCQWSISGTTLEITGSGKMQNYYADSQVPWEANKNEITKIKITGIISIGQKSFQNIPNPYQT